MDIITKARWQVRMAAIAVFLLGFAAGGLAFHAYHAWSRSRGPLTHQEHFEQMLNRLQLSDDQKAQVHQILSDTRNALQALHKESEPRFNEIRRQTDERLQKVLTPEQWKQFQQMRDEMHGRGHWDRGPGK